MPPEISPDTRLISGSEVSAWQTCQMQWWFKHKVHLVPKWLPDGLFRGIMGHEALANYYKAIRQGKSEEDAQELMFAFVDREFDKISRMRKEGDIPTIRASERQDLIVHLEGLLREYVAFYMDDFRKYEIVEVEHMHVSGNFFAMRLDLLLREYETNKLVLMDHKFVGNLYTERQIMVNSQLPRYMRVVVGDREEIVSHGLLNQICHRKNLKDGERRFSRARVPYKEKRIARRNAELELLSDEIRDQYRKSNVESKDSVKHTVNDNTCKYCSFATACTYDMDDDDRQFRLELDMNFERSTYGYN